MLTAGMILQSRYRIVGPIGQGGMGAVYEAIHEQLKSRFALKQMTVAGDQLSRAFEREAQLLASLRHPALPRVIDHFTEQHGQFLVMEFIEGRDLGEMLHNRGGAFPPDQVLGWADQLLDALDYLHTQPTPIIHRDIKPPNLKLTRRGEIILLDFGLAKGSTALQTRAATAHSVMGYTPQYAPLEQIQGAGTTERSDLFSLAATLYYLATNQQPADALTRASAVIQGDPDPLVPPAQLNPQLPQVLNDGLMGALALNPKQRPASAAAMRDGLKAASPQPPLQPAVIAKAQPVAPTLVAAQPPVIAAHQGQQPAYTGATLSVNQSAPAASATVPSAHGGAAAHAFSALGGSIMLFILFAPAIASPFEGFISSVLGLQRFDPINYFVVLLAIIHINRNPWFHRGSNQMLKHGASIVLTEILFIGSAFIFQNDDFYYFMNSNFMAIFMLEIALIGILSFFIRNFIAKRKSIWFALLGMTAMLLGTSHGAITLRSFFTDDILSWGFYLFFLGCLLSIGSSIALLRRKPAAP